MLDLNKMELAKTPHLKINELIAKYPEYSNEIISELDDTNLLACSEGAVNYVENADKKTKPTAIFVMNMLINELKKREV